MPKIHRYALAGMFTSTTKRGHGCCAYDASPLSASVLCPYASVAVASAGAIAQKSIGSTPLSARPAPGSVNETPTATTATAIPKRLRCRFTTDHETPALGVFFYEREHPKR
jgi:hypothetical protein